MTHRELHRRRKASGQRIRRKIRHTFIGAAAKRGERFRKSKPFRQRIKPASVGQAPSFAFPL